jgi:hypothetical protein
MSVLVTREAPPFIATAVMPDDTLSRVASVRSAFRWSLI